MILRHGVLPALRIHLFKNLVYPCIVCSQISATSATKLNDDSPLKSCHTITRDQIYSQLSIPREDHTTNRDVAKANWMITKLCGQGKISEARHLFDEMPEKDVISWTGLISGYIKCGLIDEARALFDTSGAIKNVVTWTVLLSGYLKLGKIYEAEMIFYEMPDKNLIAWNTMIDGYVKGGRIDAALMLFDRMVDRNVVSWNIVISGLINCGRVEEARAFFDRMPIRNVISWTTMVSGLARNGLVDEARLLFDRMQDKNVVSWNAMITGYAENMRLGEAYGLFKMMPRKDVQSWNAMITGFIIRNGELERARRLFDWMPGKNIISWTAMMSGCVQCGKSEEALGMFVSMDRDGRVKPNEGTFVCVLGACSDLASLGEGMQVHQVISKTVYQETESVVSALINMYSKCGELSMARRAFDDGSIFKRDVVSWNSIIAAYAHHGCGGKALVVFGEMQRMGLKANDVTYLGLLSACSHAGLVEEGLHYFDVVVKDKSVELREEHYTCVVDLYSRAGRLKDAFDLLEQVPSKASVYAWGALLLGCNIHGNVEIGKVVANKLMDMEPGNGGAYALASNVYTTSGKWGEAETTKMKMKDRGLKKQPGCSWIEVGNKFHVFVVGDELHTEVDVAR